MTAERKRNWAQKVLGGAPLAMKQYFVDGDKEAKDSEKKQMMACDPIAETRIRNSTCVLAPETTEGPYYHSEGHPIRSNMAENQLGLLFLMNVGVIDVETCEPVPNVLVDLWMANATGYYAGHPSPRKGLEDEIPAQTGKRKGLLSAYPRDEGQWKDETWLRGALPTDQNGVTEFTSVFPGYYTGRATHVHVKVHPEWTTLPNGTFTSGRLVHTVSERAAWWGRHLFAHTLPRYAARANSSSTTTSTSRSTSCSPTTRTRCFVQARADARAIGRTRSRSSRPRECGAASYRAPREARADPRPPPHASFDNGYMPMFDIEFLGGVLQQGLIGYITMGVNMSANYEGVWSPESGRGGAVKQVPVDEDKRTKTEL